MTTSSSATSATRRSRRLADALETAAAAACSQLSLLVPTSWMILYTFSAMAWLLRIDERPVTRPRSHHRAPLATPGVAVAGGGASGRAHAASDGVGHGRSSGRRSSRRGPGRIEWSPSPAAAPDAGLD